MTALLFSEGSMAFETIDDLCLHRLLYFLVLFEIVDLLLDLLFLIFGDGTVSETYGGHRSVPGSNAFEPEFLDVRVELLANVGVAHELLEQFITLERRAFIFILDRGERIERPRGDVLRELDGLDGRDIAGILALAGRGISTEGASTPLGGWPGLTPSGTGIGSGPGRSRSGRTLPGAFCSASIRDWSFAGADRDLDGSQQATASNAATGRWRKKYFIDFDPLPRRCDRHNSTATHDRDTTAKGR